MTTMTNTASTVSSRKSMLPMAKDAPTTLGTLVEIPPGDLDHVAGGAGVFGQCKFFQVCTDLVE